jgi:hypothetical protein
MFKKLWKFLINTFLVVTRNSYKKALSLGVDHLARLVANQANPVIAAMVVTFDPVVQAYLAAEQNLNAALGDYFGETQSVESLFDFLNIDRLPYWEGQLFYHFPKGSVDANKLMHNGRGDFQTGTYEQRILAIKTFGDKCALIPLLVPLSVNVLAFHTQIASARALQLSDGEGQVAALRDLRETARVALCGEMYGNLGLLMHLHRFDPAQVEKYFDLTLLRSKKTDGPVDTEITGLVTSQATGDPIVNASAKLTLATGEIFTAQTDAQGKFKLVVLGQTETVQATIEISAPMFVTSTDAGPIEPGEDAQMNVALVPVPVP